jgi:hypothetical protein
VCFDNGHGGLTGSWLVKAEDAGYQIVPVQRLTYNATGLFLPGPLIQSDAQHPDGPSRLLKKAIEPEERRQSCLRHHGKSVTCRQWLGSHSACQDFFSMLLGQDDPIYYAFESSARARPNRQRR